MSSRPTSPPSSGSSDDHELSTFDPLNTYVPLFYCLACEPPALLVAPTTLHCGHTVCARHVRTPSDDHHRLPSDSDEQSPPPDSDVQLPPSLSRIFSGSPTHQHSHTLPTPPPSTSDPANSAGQLLVLPTCPIRNCRQTFSPGSNHTRINIPANSTVAYYPPIQQQVVHEIPHQHITVPEPRVDVSISRVLGLLERATSWVTNIEDANGVVRVQREEDIDSSDDSDDDAHDDKSEGASSQRPSTDQEQANTSLRRRRRPTSPSRDEDNVRSHIGRSPRPRKRPRHQPVNRESESDLLSNPHFTAPSAHRPQSPGHAPPTTRQGAEEYFRKELTEQLTCEICFILLYEPVTTPCQHTFCARCLHRSLDHSSRCPLCRQSLPPFSYFQDHPYNKVLLALLVRAFPKQYIERARAIEAEERDARLDVPIFVLQLSFPGTPTLLHFYEPRYRLMLRRCLESSNPCFGMIMQPRPGSAAGSEFGTMLQIRSVQMLPDGRSIVETWGSHRFRIMERGTLDGYMVGRIERIDDVPVRLEDEAERSIAALRASASAELSAASPPRAMHPSNEELIVVCHAFLEQLRNGTAPWVVQRLNSTYGPMPTDPSDFSFWMALVLPIDDHEKAKLLPIKSARLRLRLVVHWIEQLNSNWFYSRVRVYGLLIYILFLFLLWLWYKL